ncbi:MAG: inositol monophosphatase family protein [Acidobacteria bacterium]|nr:inositol monophosphatase family protein [Acidobacteriota bacterium]
MTPVDPLLVATAVEAVLRAGEIQRSRFRTDLTVTKKGPIDLVTEVDVEVESMFRALIRDRFPGHAIVAEELDVNAAAEPGTSHCWVFDPIDGTVNYAHGLPFFCASLALEIDGEASVAAVYDPLREELYTAERGGGARLNGAPLSVSATGRLIDALLCTGFPYDVHQTLDEVIGLFRTFVGRARAVRRLGSAALDLCYVAAGRLDGFWEQRLHPWDTAAGALIVTEAGGRTSGMDGGAFRPAEGHVVASNGRVHEEMLAAIRDTALARPGTSDGRS